MGPPIWTAFVVSDQLYPSISIQLLTTINCPEIASDSSNYSLDETNKSQFCMKAFSINRQTQQRLENYVLKPIKQLLLPSGASKLVPQNYSISISIKNFLFCRNHWATKSILTALTVCCEVILSDLARNFQDSCWDNFQDLCWDSYKISKFLCLEHSSQISTFGPKNHPYLEQPVHHALLFLQFSNVFMISGINYPQMLHRSVNVNHPYTPVRNLS